MAEAKYKEWLKPENISKLEAWAREGYDLEDIATKKVGVAAATLREWRQKYPAIGAAIKDGRQFVESEIEDSLALRANGFTYEEITKELRLDKDTGEMVLVPVKAVTKTVPPDVAAIIFYLCNSNPQKWRNMRSRQNVVPDDENETGVVVIPEVAEDAE